MEIYPSWLIWNGLAAYERVTFIQGWSMCEIFVAVMSRVDHVGVAKRYQFGSTDKFSAAPPAIGKVAHLR